MNPDLLLKTQEKYWANKLGLKTKNIIADGQLTKESRIWEKHGIPIIWVQGFHSQTPGKEEDPIASQTTGLRYAIYMAAVLLGGNKELALKKLQPQDIFVLLKLVVMENKDWDKASLAAELDMELPELHQTITRTRAAHLAVQDQDNITPHFRNLEHFLLNNFKKSFPPQYGTQTRGVATSAHPASPIAIILPIHPPELINVWPNNKKQTRGIAITPLYKSAPEVALKDQKFWEMLALVDVLRSDLVNEREIAIEEIKNRLTKAAQCNGLN